MPPNLHSGWTKTLSKKLGITRGGAGRKGKQAPSAAEGAYSQVSAATGTPGSSQHPLPRSSATPPVSAKTKGKQRARDPEPSPPPAPSHEPSPEPPRKPTPEPDTPPPKRRRVSVEEVPDEGDNDSGVQASTGEPTCWLLSMLPLISINDTYLERKAKGYEAWYQRVRLLRRALGEFVSIEATFTQGAEIDASPERLAKLNPAAKYTRECHLLHSWKILQHFQKDLLECEDHLREHPDDAVAILEYMDAVAGRVRSEDLCRLRDDCILYANPDKGVYAHLQVKANRGFKHPLTARLLCPITMRDVYDEDPDKFRHRVLNGDETLIILGRDWPIFIYDEAMYVKGQAKLGLLRSQFLLQCYRRVFTGPQSTSEELEQNAKSKGKPSIARKYELDTVTAQSIIYVAVLVRSALSSCGQWKDADGRFTGHAFTRSLMKAFHSHPTWADNTLLWWQQQIYGGDPTNADSDDDADGNGTCAADLMGREEDDAQADA